MSNVFVNLPFLAANGPGAAVDVAAMGATKTIIAGGVFDATVTVEYSTQVLAPTLWAPVPGGSFTGNPGRVQVDLAAKWMRLVTSGFKGGTPNVDVGAPFAPAMFADLTGGAPVDISSMPPFKTVLAGGACNVEFSEDGVSYSQVFGFQNKGGQSGLVTGQFARVTGGAMCFLGAAAPGIDAEPTNLDLAIEAAGSFTPNPPTNVTVNSQSGHFVAPAVYVGVGVYQIHLLPIPGVTTAAQVIPTATGWDPTAIIVGVTKTFVVDHVMIEVRTFTAGGAPLEARFFMHVDILAP